MSCAIGGWHHQRPHQEGGSRAQGVEQRGDGRGRGALVRGKPRGGKEGSRVHHRGPRQAVQQLPSVNQPERHNTPRPFGSQLLAGFFLIKKAREIPSAGDGATAQRNEKSCVKEGCSLH